MLGNGRRTGGDDVFGCYERNFSRVVFFGKNKHKRAHSDERKRHSRAYVNHRITRVSEKSDEQKQIEQVFFYEGFKTEERHKSVSENADDTGRGKSLEERRMEIRHNEIHFFYEIFLNESVGVAVASPENGEFFEDFDSVLVKGKPFRSAGSDFLFIEFDEDVAFYDDESV